ncbi:ATP-binding protein [Bifidobacterium crudilactis]|uniref:ATP-binding protein n=1 Tax=Bifidobacterium crudilactis TaxID=327277 RepID=UPI002352F889|nr:ATP-binding protein [Bifidobacterium crudilactis]MCI1218498.1 ATP-binding protein [Bifidobacterium crudilactis]
MSIRDHDAPHGETVLRAGSYGCAPVMPLLSVRELARVDADGILAHEGMAARLPARRRRRAERLATHDLKTWEQEQQRAEPDTHVAADTPTLPVRRRILRSGLTGYAPRVPWHGASMPQAGLLDPFTVSGHPPFDGPLIGRSLLTGGVWRYDAWQPYQQGVATSVNGWVAGLMGSGKSLMLKAFATRETTMPWNRRIIIEGDPKGEWARVANAIGGQVVRVGRGAYLNPLDPGPRPAMRDARDWRGDVLAMQRDALASIGRALRPGTPSDPREQAVLSAAMLDHHSRDTTPTIAGLLDLLQSEWPERATIRGLDAGQARGAANRLLLLYDPLVHGAEAGAFEHESTIGIDPASPMIVFDTGSVTESNELRKRLYMAAMSANVERLCAQRDGRYRIVIGEEGHQLLANPELVKRWDWRMRMSGELGVSNWILLHELADLDKFAPPGSQTRIMIRGILTLSDTQVIYRQSAAGLKSLDGEFIPDLTDDERTAIRTMPAYGALWRVGGTIRDVVRVAVSPAAYETFNTDEHRGG